MSKRKLHGITFNHIGTFEANGLSDKPISVWGASVTVNHRRLDGSTYTVDRNFRLVCEPGGWRADRHEMGSWESIDGLMCDGGERTMSAAAFHVRDYINTGGGDFLAVAAA